MHAIVQTLEDADAAWVHAWLHRTRPTSGTRATGTAKPAGAWLKVLPTVRLE